MCVPGARLKILLRLLNVHSRLAMEPSCRIPVKPGIVHLSWFAVLRAQNVWDQTFNPFLHVSHVSDTEALSTYLKAFLFACTKSTKSTKHEGHEGHETKF